MTVEVFLIAAALALVAALYSSVGHGGASGYLAVLAIAGLAREELRPIALSLNVVVTIVATWRFWPHFSWRLFWPFAAASIPCAFIAGRWIHLEHGVYNLLLGLVLLYAAWRLLTSPRQAGDGVERRPVLPLALAAGAVIGLVSGMIGVGGGIFLSPLIILAGWANARTTAAVSAAFILINSAAALAGLVIHHGGAPVEPARLGVFAGAVLVAGFLGSTFGASRIDQTVLKRLLAVVLIIAAAKMIVTALTRPHCATDLESDAVAPAVDADHPLGVE